MKMRIGFIGCGGFSGGNHIPNAAANPKFDIVAFCDLDEAKLSTLAEQYNPNYVTTDMRHLMTDPDIELIICGTKPDFRLPIM
jgi:predicted dehydrogenase